jgi:tripartite-type tricarboxylate transporter receptor subunit TctC
VTPRRTSRSEEVRVGLVAGGRNAAAAVFGVAAMCAIAILVGAAAARAETPYPTRPIRVIVPFPPGGSTDVFLRILAPPLSELLGQPVVIENKAGAAGVIGFDTTAKAPKDGYTVGIVLTGYVIAPLLPGATLPFDPAKDLVPVIWLGKSPNVLSVPSAHPAKTIAELLALARAKPGALTVGHAGNGTSVHLTAELFVRHAGLDLVIVPYKGGGPVVTDLTTGHLDMAFNQLTTVLAHIRGGSLRPIALAAERRSPIAPDVPTLDEAGVPGVHTTEWYGAMVPAGTPPAVIQRLNTAFDTALRDPTVVARCRDLALEIEGGAPERFSTLIASEVDKWASIIRETGATNQ